MKFYPYKKKKGGGRRKSLSHAEWSGTKGGGGAKSFGPAIFPSCRPPPPLPPRNYDQSLTKGLFKDRHQWWRREFRCSLSLSMDKLFPMAIK